jgi:polysaccharide pyruvyl transferase WcaK-like protein
MGVSALAESSIKCIIHRWPEAEIILLGSGHIPGQHCLTLSGKEICFQTLPIRFSKNILLPCHFLRFVLHALLTKLLPASRLKDALVNRNQYFKLLFETDLVADITAGDSFSDIYGFRRFLWVFLYKWLVIFSGKKLVLLPQTYGPFKKTITRMMSRYILSRASIVYCRDLPAVEYLKTLLGTNHADGKVRFAPDVAFILDARAPEHFDSGSLLPARTEKSIVVGVNISGLLFNGGYTQNNMFGLKTSYADLMKAVIERLLMSENVIILLIPHVFPPADLMVESDAIACSRIYELLHPKYPGKIFLVENRYSQGEIKHIIGLCDFFIGARMHTCIAAMSQNIPTVGIAYSKKFEGVFESVGLADCVADARSCDEGQLLEKVELALEQKDRIKKHLEDTMPSIKQGVLNIFEG